MLLEEKVAELVAVRERLEELELKKKTLVAEILALMPKDKTTAHVLGYRVRRTSMLLIKTSLDDARLFDAVAMKEVVDRKRLRELYKAGHHPPDVSELHYVIVSPVKEAVQEV